MKLEKNMYIRTMSGISKIIEVRKAESMTRVVDDYGNIYFVDDLIVEPSYDITVLVQIGDYVNGYRVDEIQDGHLFNYNSYDGWPVSIVSCDNDIEGIVTKEQFENAKYKVPKNNCEWILMLLLIIFFGSNFNETCEESNK